MNIFLRKNIIIWLIATTLGIALIIAMLLLWLQNQRIQSLQQTITKFENQLAIQEIGSQPALSDKIPEEPQEQTISGEVSFDGCGALSEYENKVWYSELTKNTALTIESYESTSEQTATLQEVSDVCFSENSNLFVMLVPGDYALGPKIYQFNTESFRLKQAILEDNGRGWLASPDEFGKREDNIIHLEGTSGDAGAGSTMYFEYDFVKNVVELKKEYIFSADNLDNGTWQYY